MRERARAMSDTLDRRRITQPPQTVRELVVVIDGGTGNFPTQPGQVALTHPVEIDADDREGAIPAFSADTDQTIPVVFIRGAPSVGDYVVAHATAGRWVAERGNATKKCYNVSVQVGWCGCDSEDYPPGVVTISIYQGACNPASGGNPATPGGALITSNVADNMATAGFMLPPGQYCADATTTADGFMSSPASFTVGPGNVITQGPGNTGTPVAVFVGLFPDHLTIDDKITGITATVYPYGSIGPPTTVAGELDYGNGGVYISHSTYSGTYPATATCPGGPIQLSYLYSCTGYVTSFTFWAVDANGNRCPGGDANPFEFGNFNVASGGDPGTGPGTGHACYPVNLTLGSSVPGLDGTATVKSS
jgi:hypothetical protein